MESFPKFLQGIFGFTGTGLSTSALLDTTCVYTVSSTKRAQLVYLRAGNSSDALICLTLMRDGKPMRLFPIGAKAAAHVPLTVVEDLEPDTKIEMYISAPAGVAGEVVVDLGLLEI
jgi:hypothetical protein